MSQLLFNDRLYPADNLSIKFIWLMMKNPDYQKQLLLFWEYFPKSPQGEVLTVEILQLFTAIFKCYIILPDASLKLLATNFLQAYTLQEYIPYDLFASAMTQFIFNVVEYPDLSVMVRCADKLHNRIFRLEVMDVKQNICSALEYHIQVEFYAQDSVEYTLKPDQRFKKSFHPIYFQETYEYDSWLINQSINDPTKLRRYSLVPLEQIVPIGLSAESVVFILQNNNYNVAPFYNLHSTQYPFAQQVKVRANTPASFLSGLPNSLLVPTIGLHPIITHTLDQYGESLPYYRLNKLFIREIQWAQQSTQSLSGTKLLTNVKSDFFTDDDYNVDQIHKLHKRWERKTLQGKRPIATTFDLTTGKSSNPDKRKPKVVKLNQVLGDLNQLKEQYKLEESVANLIVQNGLHTQGGIELPSFNSYITRFISKFGKLPTDPINPYEEDVLTYARQFPQQILLIGKPRTGRSTFAKALAQRLDIEVIDLERGIVKIFAKVTENESNPQTDEEGVPKEFLSPLEREVYDNLRFGRTITLESLEQLVNLELQLDITKNKGYILDLPMEEPFWVNSIMGHRLALPKLGCRYFNYVIRLNQSDEDVQLFASKIMERPEDLGITSQFDREEQRRPIVKFRDLNDPDLEEEEEVLDEDKPPLLEEKDLFYRPMDQEHLIECLNKFNRCQGKLQELYQHLPDPNILNIDAAGLTVAQLVDLCNIREPLRPLAIKLEGSGEKDLLTVNLTDEKLNRMWSAWQQIDPVELLIKEKMVVGKAEFAADYAGRVFLFDNEDNLNKFLAYPRKYLQLPPQLPKSTIISVVGPKQSGKNVVAAQLAEHYGLKLVDVEEIVKNKAITQQQNVKHIPSTFDPRINDIHLTEVEWKEFMKGNAIKDVLPMILNYLGVPLQKKPLGWGEPKKEEDDAPPPEEDEEKKKKESKKAAAAAKKKKEEPVVEVDVEPVKPVTPPPEDVITKEIIPLLDAELKVPDTSKPRGIVLIGYPSTQEQIDQLTLFGIKIDRVVMLADKSEEPGQILQQRYADINLESELANTAQVGTLLREAVGEDNVKEVSIEGSKEEVWIRVRTLLDPFYIRVDDESLVRVPGDVQEGDDPIQYGDYGPYCPVTLKNTGWLVPGKEEFVSLVRGRMYRFYGEKEQQQFKESVVQYTDGTVVAPPSRIMMLGVRGSGLRTQLAILNKTYKLPIINIKDNLIANLTVHKQNRQQERYFNKGFKPQEVDGDGNPVVDTELTEDPPEFDRKIHEIEVLNKILNCGGTIINGNFYDVGEEIVSTPIVDLMVEAKKLPEIVILLKVEQDNFIKRNFDNKTIEDEYTLKMEQLREKRQQERKEARQKAIEDAVPEEEWPPLDGNDEEDPEAPKLEDMLKEGKDKLISQHEADIAKIEDLQRQFEELKITAIIISTDTTIENVTERINVAIENVVDRDSRNNLFEKYQTYKLNPYPDPENFTINRLSLYEKSYTHQRSKFGDRNPITLVNVPHCRDYPLIYRNRIYYLDNEEQRNQAADRPLNYLKGITVPSDVHIRPCIFILGTVKSGKTTIAKLLSTQLNLVHLKVSHLLEQFITNQTDTLAQYAKNLLTQGKSVDSETVIKILQKRIQLQDCQQNGWVLDGFPQTFDDALLLSKSALIPTVVFICERDSVDILNTETTKFGGIDMILNQRFKSSQVHVLGQYYQHTFNNLRYIQIGQVCNWGLLSMCNNYIQRKLLARAHLARALLTQQPVQVSELTLSTDQIVSKLGPLLNYCPVMLKANKLFVARSLRCANLVFYDDQFYVMSSDDTEQDFIKNPIHYTNNSLTHYPVPKIITVGDKIEQQFEYKGHCPVQLLNNKLVQGLTHLIVAYKGNQFIFSNATDMVAFEENPHKYKYAHLPDKMPLGDPKESKNLAKKVAKKGDCTSYLELHLRNIIIKVLAQLGYQRIKYPTLSCKETVLKFIAISLKANNNNKDHKYRQKYQQKLNDFLQHCAYPQEIQKLNNNIHDEVEEENFLKTVEVFDDFMNKLTSCDKQKYFERFIR